MKEEGYRLNVGIMVANSVGELLLCKRKGMNSWQFPQGGIDKNEDPLRAAKRELFEETSIKSIEILKEIDGFFEYQLPNNLVGIIWKGKFRGQKQKWFITRFIGDEKEINLKTQHPEFIEWKWILPDKLPEVIVNFKKEMYIKLLKIIKEFIG